MRAWKALVMTINDDTLTHGPLLCHFFWDSMREIKPIDQLETKERGGEERGRRGEMSQGIIA